MCDPDDRKRVIVRPGWVIDRAGNDVRIDETELDFMRLVREHDDDADNPKDILDADGIGDAWLFWSPAAGAAPTGSGSSPTPPTGRRSSTTGCSRRC